MHNEGRASHPFSQSHTYKSSLGLQQQLPGCHEVNFQKGGKRGRAAGKVRSSMRETHGEKTQGGGTLGKVI